LFFDSDCHWINFNDEIIVESDVFSKEILLNHDVDKEIVGVFLAVLRVLLRSENNWIHDGVAIVLVDVHEFNTSLDDLRVFFGYHDILESLYSQV
jgi:hypothetical protein